MKIVRALILAAIFIAALSIGGTSIAGEPDVQICDVGADYSLGTENYADAIRLHREIVRNNPLNALAHYHLGFAEGMVGDESGEVREYERAATLGLRIWDLFLNLGLAQLERGDLSAARVSLRKAVLFGGKHAESHFNLALFDERCGLLDEAERETRTSLLLSPGDSDERNLLAEIYAEEGKIARAAEIWLELSRDAPDYAPARRNLAILGASEASVEGSAIVFLRGSHH